MKQVAIILFNIENKNSCLAQIHPRSWERIATENNDKTISYYVIVPSPAFRRLILDEEYLKIVDQYPECFGTGDDWQIVKAIKKFEERFFVRPYSDEEFFDYIRSETMAYVFNINMYGTISDKILRLDLCRDIHQGNEFQGGIFHILKHFSLENYGTLSSFGKQYIVNRWSDILLDVIQNFYSEPLCYESKNCFEAKSTLKDGHCLRGIYYNNQKTNVYFLNSIRIDNH